MDDAKHTAADDGTAMESSKPNDCANPDETMSPAETTSVSYPTQILDGVSREAVEAVIVEGMDTATAKDVDAQWGTATNALLTELAAQAPGEFAKPEHVHWRWERKIAYMQQSERDHRFFVLKCQNQQVEGLTIIALGETCRISAQAGSPLVYIEYIAAAPWNNAALLAQAGKLPRYKFVGSALITRTIQYSIQCGFRGRIGLHALPQAATFYRNVCRMTALDFDEDHEGLQYFEFTEEQALAYLKGA